MSVLKFAILLIAIVAAMVLGCLWVTGALKADPQPGQTWDLYPRDPFEKHPVTVLQVQDGHVLFQYPHGGTNSEAIPLFKQSYTQRMERT